MLLVLFKNTQTTGVDEPPTATETGNVAALKVKWQQNDTMAVSASDKTEGSLETALQSSSQLYPSSDEEGELDAVGAVLPHKAVMEKFKDGLAELIVVR